ncbi:MAG: hypothetical protein ACTH1D_11300 [Mycobacteriaceae bacterium]
MSEDQVIEQNTEDEAALADEGVSQTDAQDDAGTDETGVDEKSLRSREAAKYRTRARDAEKRVEELTAVVESMRDAEFTRQLDGLHPSVKGETLAALGMARSEFTADDGTVDTAAMRSRAEALVKAHGLGSFVPGALPNDGDKHGPVTSESKASWSDVLTRR